MQAQTSPTVEDATRILDNMAGDIEVPWAYISPDLVFDAHSPARSLPRPAGLARADLGYFGDGAMIRQYSRTQLAQMRTDHAGFAMARDLDGDGVAEIYRTGFWRTGDPRTGEAREGSFLAVFDPGRAPQVVDSYSADITAGIFLSASGVDLVVAMCNCPEAGTVAYRNKRLTVTWTDEVATRSR